MSLNIEAGDLLLFERPCSKMDIFSGFICCSAKLTAVSRYDHIGVVAEDNNGILVLLEANMNGVTARPLLERLQRTSAISFTVRKLLGPKPPAFKAALRELTNQAVGKQYNSSITSMLQGLVVGYYEHGILAGFRYTAY